MTGLKPTFATECEFLVREGPPVTPSHILAPLALNRSGAVFSDCRTYRYSLYRMWSHEPQLGFIMLNPSTADENVEDPTIRRCMASARDLGYGGVHICNLFAFRSTDPTGLKATADPIGPTNDSAIDTMVLSGIDVIAAWGDHGTRLGRSMVVRSGTGGGSWLCGSTRQVNPPIPSICPRR